MESCLGVEREVSRVQDKITSVRNAQRKTLDEVIDAVQKAKQELENGRKPNKCFLFYEAIFSKPHNLFVTVRESNPLSPSQTITLIQALQAAKESTKKTAADHRDLHSSVSKVGKAIDRNFVSDYDSTSRNDIFRCGYYRNFSLFFNSRCKKCRGT